MPKGVPNKRYTPEFKQMVVEAVREGHMAYNEAERHYDVPHGRIQNGNTSILQKALRVLQSSDVGVAAQAVLRNFLKRWKMIY